MCKCGGSAGRVLLVFCLLVFIFGFSGMAYGAGSCDPQGGIRTIGFEYVADSTFYLHIRCVIRQLTGLI